MATVKHYMLARYQGPSSKLLCPNCGQRTWKPYVDEDGQPFSADFQDAEPKVRELAERVGRCDNERKCGYNYPPRDFFKDTKAGVPEHSANWVKPEPPKTAEPLNFELVKRSAQPYRSVFGKWLRDDLKLPAERLDEVLKDYWVGATNEGRIIYWLIDINGKCRDGKMMAYKNDGHRDHDKHPRWARKIGIDKAALQGRITTKQRDAMLNELVIRRCFGEHLLSDERYKQKPVAIVEGEKSCLICSTLHPQFIWIACGGNGLNIARILPAITQKRKIFIFPDMDMLDKWKALAEGLKYPRIVWMGDYIKENARTDKDDVGDIVLRMWQEGGHVPDARKVIEPPPPEPPETPEQKAEEEKLIRCLQLQVAHERLGLTEPSIPLTILFERLQLELADVKEEIADPDYIGF